MVGSLIHSLRQRNKSTEEDTSEPLDEDEQAELIQEMERQNSQQDHFFRNAFFLVALVFSLLKLYCAISQVFLPWQLPFHVYLDEVFPPWIATLLELLSVAPFVLVGLYIRPLPPPEVGTSTGQSPAEQEFHRNRLERKRRMLHLALLAHVPVLMVLLPSYLFTLPTSPISILHFVWFVGLSLGYIALCKYLDNAMVEVEQGVRSLYNYTYSYKKA